MRCARFLAGLVTLCAALAGPASATKLDAAERCTSIADDRARLACYDEALARPAGARAEPFPAATGAAADGAASAMPNLERASAPTSPEADFGLSEAAKRARDPDAAGPSHPDSITEKVASVGRRPTGELVVTLANGQVWVQIDTNSQARVATGDTVTIKKASLGSYLLVTQSRAAVRVRRTK